MTDPELDVAPKKDNTLKILGLIGCGCLILVGGCFAVLGGATWWGLGQLEEMAVESLQEEPAIQEHIGDIESCELEIMEMAEGGGDELVFSVVGSKGSGTVHVDERDFDEGSGELRGGTLVLDDGREIPLGRR
jgi:hypothetical protein